jgi:hypothetical protein
MVRLDYWLPSQFETKIIDPFVVKQLIESLVVTFSGLRSLFVDTRGNPTWGEIVREISRRLPRVRRWMSNKDESLYGWNFLQQRILATPNASIRLQNDKEMLKEFSGIRWKAGINDNQPRVVDRDRRKSHKDITEALAMCCFLVDLESRRATAPSMASRFARGKDENRTTRLRETLFGSKEKTLIVRGQKVGENSW